MDGLRLANRLASVLLALVLLAGGVLVAVEIVLAALDRQPWVIPHDDWYRDARQAAWSDEGPVALFVVLVLVGLALLLLELARRRVQALPLADRAEGAHADLDRRGVERWLATRLADVEGVTAPKARITRKKVLVSAVTPQSDAAEVEQRLGQAAEDNLHELDLAEPLRIKSKVTSRRSS